MTPDIINGLFEFVGAFFLAINVKQLYIDKEVKGIKITPTVYFSLWGLWNLYFYPSFDKWFSFYGGLALVIVNILWVGQMIYYTYYKEKER